MNLGSVVPRCCAVLLASLAPACGGDVRLPSSSGVGLDLSIIGGNNQTGTVGLPLPDPLVVEVVAGDSPAEGHKVAFINLGDTSAGQLKPDTAVTDESGHAVAEWVLGSAPGPHEVEARLVVTEPEPPPTAVFGASAVVDRPDSVRAVSPLSQPGRIGRPTAEPPVVLIVDRFGNPVAAVPVAWQVTAGGGTVSSPETVTSADGRATVTWTLGTGVIAQKLTARLDGVHGSPVTFTATVLF